MGGGLGEEERVERQADNPDPDTLAEAKSGPSLPRLQYKLAVWNSRGTLGRIEISHFSFLISMLYFAGVVQIKVTLLQLNPL